MIVKELLVKLGMQIDDGAFRKADAMIAGFSRGLLAFGTAAVAGVAMALTAIAKSSANAGDHIKKLSQSTGVDSIALQEFGYSADLAGVSMEEMAHGLQHLAKTGVKDVRAEVLKLADRFKAMPNDGRKVEIAMEKFGRAGARMIPWLNAGAKGISDMAKEAHDLGIIFDGQAQDAAEEFNDNLTRLGYGFAGLRNVIGNALIPILNKLVLGFLGFVKFVRANWQPAMQKIALALKVTAFILGGVLLAALAANIGVVATAVSWYAALGVAAVAAAIKAAIAWAAAAAPVVLLAAYFTAVLLILEDVYVFLQGGDSLLGEMVIKAAMLHAEFAAMDVKPGWFYALEGGFALLNQMLTMVRALLFALEMVGRAFEKIGEGIDFISSKFGDVPALQIGSVLAHGGAQGTVGAVNGLFGTGGASPRAAAALNPSARTQNTTINHTVGAIHVHATPGMNVQDLANQVTRQLDEHFDGKMRQAVVGMQ